MSNSKQSRVLAAVLLALCQLASAQVGGSIVNPSASGGTTVTKTGFYLTFGATNYLAKSMYAVTAPPTYTNLNLGTGTTKTVNADGSVTLSVPTGTSGYNGISAATFTTQAVIAFGVAGNDDATGGSRYGLLLRESSTSKVAMYPINLVYNDFPKIGNAACYTANGLTYAGVGFGLTRALNFDPGMLWVKVVVNGSNYDFYWSGDGTNYIKLTGDTTAKTTCFTTGADQVGIGINNPTGYTVSATVFSQASS